MLVQTPNAGYVLGIIRDPLDLNVTDFIVQQN